MATWCVHYLVHVTTPYTYVPRLVITGVPDDAVVTADLLQGAGYTLGKLGILRPNYGLARLGEEAPRDLVQSVRQGEGEHVSWDDLLCQAKGAKVLVAQ
ncbi:MAG: hypothetical protein HY691_05465 [Chloroflexi bacterium]|nr:hypothetical protein [Chloroflexota bacterium]